MLKKNILQLFLIILLIAISIFFYQKYMISNDISKKLLEKDIDSTKTNKVLISKESREATNVIENLRYTSNDLFGNTYIINAQSAQVEDDKVNEVRLYNVVAQIIQKNNEIIFINSNFAD